MNNHNLQIVLPPPLRAAFEEALQGAVDQKWVDRIWERDAGLWSGNAAEQEQVRARLGWLTLDDWAKHHLDAMERYVDEVEKRGINHCVWLGMGGSSLAARVVAELSGAAPRIRLSVCDQNHPQAILALRESLDLERTLFIVASKSGATIETDCLLHYFHQEVEHADLDPKPRFAAVTDPGSALDQEAKQRGFHQIFHNPPDVGGRFGALTHTGLLAAAFCGRAPAHLVAESKTAMDECRTGGHNPWLQAGIALGVCAQHGHDKVVLQLPPSLQALAPWIEQLISESSGKQQRGLVPVLDEDDGALLPGLESGGGACRVNVREQGDADGRDTPSANPDSQMPCIEWQAAPLGAEWFRWQFITVIACAALKVNPFDEPAVAYNKIVTQKMLAPFDLETLPPQVHAPFHTSGGIHCVGEPIAGDTLEQVLHNWLEALAPGDYLGLLSHLAPGALPPETKQRLRRLAARRRCWCTPCEGPSYLHSTGQLHKDGPDKARFLLLSDNTKPELPVPGTDYGFTTLHRAQAIADVIALMKYKRTVLYLHLDTDTAIAELDATLAQLETAT